VANSHHFRFVGIEFAPAPGTRQIYAVVAIGNTDASPATLAHHIVFDRCYVHGDPNSSDRRGIEMDGAYVAVVDSYISDFQDNDPVADSQALWAYNTTGPLQIRNNYIEAATENVMFGGADSREPVLVPTSIEIRDNHFYKPLSLIPTRYTMKNLLEFKAAQRVLVTGNVFENNPAKSQNGFALLITPRNNGHAPWAITSDIAIVGNTFINVGSGLNVAGLDNLHPSLMTERVLIRDNIVGVTGLNEPRPARFSSLPAAATTRSITIRSSTPRRPRTRLSRLRSPTAVRSAISCSPTILRRTPPTVSLVRASERAREPSIRISRAGHSRGTASSTGQQVAIPPGTFSRPT